MWDNLVEFSEAVYLKNKPNDIPYDSIYMK